MPFACIFVPDFPVEALVRAEPELRSQAVAVLEGKAPLQKIFAVNEKSRRMGIEPGMTKIQVESCTELTLRPRLLLQETAAHAALLDCAQSFSPRTEDTAPDTVLLDLSGLESLFGSLPKIARDIARRTADLGLEANVATASNPDTALFAARGFAGVTVVQEGEEAEHLGNLPLDVLFPELSSAHPSEEAVHFLETFDLWGVRNLRALCALPEIALSERLGQPGIRLQQLARGAIARTLIPVDPPLIFEEAMELDHPLVLLEPLAFLLAHMLDQLCARLAARALAAQELRLQMDLDTGFHSTEDFDCHPERSEGPMHFAGSTKPGETSLSPATRSQLVTRPLGFDSGVHFIEDVPTGAPTPAHVGTLGSLLRAESRGPSRAPARQQNAISAPDPTLPHSSNFTRTLQLPVPMLDPKVFLKLLQLDLKAHPPGAPILKVHLSAIPAQPRSIQGGLFLPPTPEPEKLELTLARIAGMVGEDKVGSLHLLDSHRPDAFRIQRFVPVEPQGKKQKSEDVSPSAPVTALRMFRPPLRATVTLRDGKPAHLVCPKRKELHGDILWMAGPWRSSGDWWEQDGWAHDEWDIAIPLSVDSRQSTGKLSAFSNSLSAQEPSPAGCPSSGKSSLGLYRLVHDLLSGRWFVEGTYD